MNREDIEQCHEIYCDQLERFAAAISRKFVPIRPSFEVVIASSRIAGRYFPQEHKCQYNLAYAVVTKDAYAETIAHECCHAYACQLMPKSKWHGDFFKFLLWTCGFDPRRCHTYDVKKIKRAAKLLLQAQKIQEASRETQDIALP